MVPTRLNNAENLIQHSNSNEKRMISGDVFEVSPPDPVVVHGNGSVSGIFTQFQPAVASYPDGRFIVVWTDTGEITQSSEGDGRDGSGRGIYGRYFSDVGNYPVGEIFRVNTNTGSSQQSPIVEVFSNGNFIVVWESTSPSVGGIRGQLFSVNGSAPDVVQQVGGEFLVGNCTDGLQSHPDVATFLDNKFVVVWQGDSCNVAGVKGQLFDEFANLVGHDFVVQINIFSTVNLKPSVVSFDTDDGRFVVSYITILPSSEYLISTKQFDQTGTLPNVVRMLELNSFSGPPVQDGCIGIQDSPIISVLTNNSFIVIWTFMEVGMCVGGYLGILSSVVPGSGYKELFTGFHSGFVGIARLPNGLVVLGVEGGSPHDHMQVLVDESGCRYVYEWTVAAAEFSRCSGWSSIHSDFTTRKSRQIASFPDGRWVTTMVLAPDVYYGGMICDVGVYAGIMTSIPWLTSNQLILLEGETVSVTDVCISGTNFVTPDAAELLYSVSNVTHGIFERAGAADVSIFNFTKQDVLNFMIFFVHDGGEIPPAYYVSVSNDIASSEPEPANITFTNVNDAPSIANNTITISDGQTITMTSDELLATDEDNDDSSLKFTISNLFNGFFQYLSFPGLPISDFLQSNITASQVQFVHNVPGIAPSYYVTVSDGQLSDGPHEATIQFSGGGPGNNTAPVLVNNSLSIAEGQSLIVSSSDLSATDIDGNEGNLEFTISDIVHGRFELSTLPGDAKITFTQQTIYDGILMFFHDGDEIGPSYSVTVSDGLDSDGPYPAVISFTNVNDPPMLIRNTLVINEGQRVLMSTATRLSAFDVDNDDNIITYTISELQNGWFIDVNDESQPIVSFGHYALLRGDIGFIHDGSEAMPTYSISVSDGIDSTTPQAATVTFSNVNDAPFVISCDMSVVEDQSVTLNASNIVVSDPDNTDAELSISVTNVKRGIFEYTNATGTPLSRLALTDVLDGLVQFTHDGNEFSPSFDLTINDGKDSSATVSANVSFVPVNDPPEVLNNRMTIGRGGAVVLNPSELSVTDVDNNDGDLLINVGGISEGMFDSMQSPGIAITSFAFQQILDGDIRFRHSGGVASPGYTVNVTDGSLYSQNEPALIIFTGGSGNIAPYIVKNRLSVVEDDFVVLTNLDLEARDTDNDDNTLLFIVSEVQHGRFELLSNPGYAIGNFEQSKIVAGDVCFFHDGSEFPPSYNIKVGDGNASDGPYAASITFTSVNDAPVITENSLSISEGLSVIISSLDLSASDSDNDDSGLLFMASQVAGGHFAYTSNLSVPIQNFTQLQITGGTVVFVHNGDELAASYDITVSDGAAMSSTQSAAIVYSPVNDAPFLLNSHFTVNEGQTISLNNFQIDAADIDSEDSTLEFIVTNIRSGYFQRMNASGVALARFSRMEVVGSEIQFVHDGLEREPSCDIAVSDGQDSSVFSPMNITFIPVNDPPFLINNQLIISEGRSLTISRNQLNADDPDNNRTTLEFTITSISNGIFERKDQIGVSVLSFSQQDIDDRLIIFIHDGGEDAPAYDVSVTDGIISTQSSGADVTFANINDVPLFIINEIIIDEDETITITDAHISATDVESDDAGLLTMVRDIDHGQFEHYASPGAAISKFTQLEIEDGNIRLVHDGSEYAPTITLGVKDDGDASSDPSQTIVTFTNINDIPELINNRLTVNMGQKITLGQKHLSATDPDNSDDDLIFEIHDTTNGYFESSENPPINVTSFSQSQVLASNITFVHDGGQEAPSYSVSVYDGIAKTVPAAAEITFSDIENISPRIIFSRMSIMEGERLTLTNADIRATDPDGEDDALMFNVNQVEQGQFEFGSDVGSVISGFRQSDISSGEVLFVHDGSEIPPSFQLGVSDGMANTPFSNATVTFTHVNDAPSIIENKLTVNEGESVILAPSNLGAIDPDNDETALVFSVSNARGGVFENIDNPEVPLSTFQQQHILDEKIMFTHDGGEDEPGYDVSVSDGILTGSLSTAQVDFTHINDEPVLWNNQLTLKEGEAVQLTSINLSADDDDNDASTLEFNMADIRHGQFEKTSQPGEAITRFAQHELANAEIVFGHDGGEDAPVFSVSVDDGSAATEAQSANIEFSNINDAPEVNKPIQDRDDLVVDRPFELMLEDDTFVDADGDALSLSAKQSDGSPLPEYTEFNEATKMFKANFVNPGSARFSIFARDPSGEEAESSFSLTAKENPAQKDGGSIAGTVVLSTFGAVCGIATLSAAGYGIWNRYRNKKFKASRVAHQMADMLRDKLKLSGVDNFESEIGGKYLNAIEVLKQELLNEGIDARDMYPSEMHDLVISLSQAIERTDLLSGKCLGFGKEIDIDGLQGSAAGLAESVKQIQQGEGLAQSEDGPDIELMTMGNK